MEFDLEVPDEVVTCAENIYDNSAEWIDVITVLQYLFSGRAEISTWVS